MPRATSRWILAGLLGALAGAVGAMLRPAPPSAGATPTEVRGAPENPVTSTDPTPVPAPSVTVTAAPASAAPVSVAPASVAARVAPSDEGPRIYSKTRFVWIRERPDWGSQWIGYLWPGGSVRLASSKPIYARGCQEWYAVVPRGYVCHDRYRTTLDANDAQFVEVAHHSPDLYSPAPYRYAESLGAERYETLPDRAAQRAREPGLSQFFALVERARQGGPREELLLGVDLTPATEEAVPFTRLPLDIQFQRKRLRRDSTLAYTGEYTHEDRTFLLTPDLAWVPKDRVRPFSPVTFRGVMLGPDIALPIAFFRERDRPAYRKSATGAFVSADRHFARLAWVPLTGRSEFRDGTNYLETREPDLWIAETDAVVPKLREHTPWGAAVGEPDTHPLRPKGRATWIDTSVYGGWLIAYEDSHPVFVTLVAPGRGGARPANDANLTETSSSPLGIFPITGKFVTANMDGPENVIHSDVPWVQNFRGPHAIHGAYWHDSWGERVSGGCLNVSPADSRTLFDFTDPKLPEGWHGVRWAPELEAATLVVIHP
jgi:hypothetical protein